MGSATQDNFTSLSTVGSIDWVMTYNCHRQRVGRWLARMTGGHPDAADLAQEVFMVAITRAQTFDSSRSQLTTWLFGIAKRIAANWRRSQSNKRRMESRVGKDPRPTSKPDAPDEWIASAQLLAGFKTCLSALPERPREALLLRVCEDASYEDIARRLTISHSNATILVHRAKKAVSQYMSVNQLC